VEVEHLAEEEPEDEGLLEEGTALACGAGDDGPETKVVAEEVEALAGVGTVEGGVGAVGGRVGPGEDVAQVGETLLLGDGEDVGGIGSHDTTRRADEVSDKAREGGAREEPGGTGLEVALKSRDQGLGVGRENDTNGGQVNLCQEKGAAPRTVIRNSRKFCVRSSNCGHFFLSVMQEKDFLFFLFFCIFFKRFLQIENI
jgi:hypothetical protein